MRHYVYCTTNKVTGKIYVGVRSTKKDKGRDCYLGSGRDLKMAISKYGRDAFKKEILKEFASREDALEFEAQVVNEQFVASDETYNLIVGGGTRPVLSGESNPRYGKTWPEEWKEEQSKRMVEYYNENKATNLGRRFSDEWRKNISEGRIRLGVAKGSKNPRSYGNVRITDLEGNETIYDTAKVAAKEMGVDRFTLTQHCKNQTSYQIGKYKGWTFEFVKD